MNNFLLLSAIPFYLSIVHSLPSTNSIKQADLKNYILIIESNQQEKTEYTISIIDTLSSSYMIHDNRQIDGNQGIKYMLRFTLESKPFILKVKWRKVKKRKWDEISFNHNVFKPAFDDMQKQYYYSYTLKLDTYGKY